MFSVKIIVCVHAKSLQSCLTLCNPMDCSLPGSSVHGILQARILEWAAMPHWDHYWAITHSPTPSIILASQKACVSSFFVKIKKRDGVSAEGMTEWWQTPLRADNGHTRWGGGQSWISQEAWSGHSGLSNLELNGREGPAGTWLPQLSPLTSLHPKPLLSLFKWWSTHSSRYLAPLERLFPYFVLISSY